MRSRRAMKPSCSWARTTGIRPGVAPSAHKGLNVRFGCRFGQRYHKPSPRFCCSMAAKDKALEIAEQTGLKAVGGRVFGRYKGHPLSVSLMTAGRAITSLKIPPDVFPRLAAIEQ